jgi:hypothetical protein
MNQTDIKLLLGVARKIHIAYEANLDLNGEPENDTISGNLGEALEIVHQLTK